MRDRDESQAREEFCRRDLLKLAAGAAAWMAAFRPRRASAQGGGKKLGAIDVHAHWQPEGYLKLMKELGRPVTNATKLNIDMAARIKRMSEMGIEKNILTILTPAIQWAKPADGLRLAQVINDAAIEAHTAYPDRLTFGVAIPLQDPALSLQELNRVAGKPAFKGLHVATSNEAKDYFFQPAFEPIIARAEQLGYPLIFHPIGTVAGADRMEGPGFLTNSIGFTLEETITCAQFIVKGVLDKYPKLQVQIPHAGGTFPYLAGRIEYGLGRRNIKLPMPFMEYVRRFHYDTITYYPETLRFLINLVGSEHVVIGTDQYATMDVANPTGLVEQLNLSAAERERIFTTNAARIYRF